ncbi:MAG: type IV secretion system protein [Alphaproteobacteria bacterium]|nr:type IV secretion system protein [Alphaproteobacteria bacterium]
MAELGQGEKRLYITNDAQKATTEGYQPEYVTDLDYETKSAKETYFRWLSRLVTLCAVLSLGFFLCATLVIFRLAPEIIVEPLLITTQTDSENMMRYEPISEKMPSIRQFTEMYIKQYVILRNTVVNDMDEMRTRWGPGGIVHYLSAPDVYREFVGKNANAVNKMFSNEYSSEVRIDSIQKESENSPAWYVNFTVYNLSRNHIGESGALVLKTMRYRASVTPKYYDERRAIYARIVNPLGFTVVKYNQDMIRE